MRVFEAVFAHDRVILTGEYSDWSMADIRAVIASSAGYPEAAIESFREITEPTLWMVPLEAL